MLKHQKTFNPLECGLCKEKDCLYRICYESMYGAGKVIYAAQCRRIQREQRKGRIVK